MFRWRRRSQVDCSAAAARRRSVWAFAYQIVPPQHKRCLETIRGLLDHEHAVARSAGRTWAGRLVLERLVTRILIVSDSPDHECGVDQRLALEVERLQVTFSRTAWMEIPAQPEPTNQAEGGGR
jgi:hypothetical protein